MAEDIGNIGGLLTPREDYVPNIESVYSNILANAPEYQYFAAPLSNQGRDTASYGTTNQFVVAPDSMVRVVNNATGEVAYTGTGYSGAQGAIDAANALSSSTGSKANWDIQVTRPGSTNFESVSTDRPDVSGLGIAADIALPVAGSLLAGPLGLGALGLGTAGAAAAGAALGSGISSTAQGRSIEDALLRAAIAGGTSYLGSQVFGATNPTGATVGENLPSWGILAEPYANAASNAALSGAVSSGLASSVPTAAGDIVVTALGRVPTVAGGAFGSLLGGIVPSYFDAEMLNSTGSSNTQPETNTTTDQQGGIVVTGRTPTNLLPPVLGVGAVGGGVALADLLANAGAANATGATTTAAEQAATRTTLTPEQLAAINAGAGAAGVLGTGLTASQLATIGGLGASAISSLLGGGSGGATTGTPYVSPFGAGPSIAGADYRVNPNIQNYEQYGFGPEATFFRPEYNKLVASGAGMGYTPPAMAQSSTQTYTPLIGGTVSGGTTGTATPTPSTSGGTVAVNQGRPAGFTGTMENQQVGDTQVVDGTTWSYGGPDVGWQMQYINDAGQKALLPGNGATNVSSFANNPTATANQPYFEQNTANIPGWATTYHGFQQGLMGAGVTGDAKAAAERELFTAIETQPFANAQSLVDYARTVYNKYTTPGLI